MGFRLETDKVLELAMKLIKEPMPWEYGDKDNIRYLKLVMYNEGVLDMAETVIKAIIELKKA